jgi:hypothetical protein
MRKLIVSEFLTLDGVMHRGVLILTYALAEESASS